MSELRVSTYPVLLFLLPSSSRVLRIMVSIWERGSSGKGEGAPRARPALLIRMSICVMVGFVVGEVVMAA